jgi:hypothetical protein
MSPWTVYLLAVISIAYPINHYFQSTYGEKNITATVLLSIFWFVIPIVSVFNLTEAFGFVSKKIISHKKGE